MKGYMSVSEAAKYLGVTRGRVLQLIDAGMLKADMMGSTWAVSEASVKKRKEAAPKAGRPKS